MELKNKTIYLVDSRSSGKTIALKDLIMMLSPERGNYPELESFLLVKNSNQTIYFIDDADITTLTPGISKYLKNELKREGVFCVMVGKELRKFPVKADKESKIFKSTREFRDFFTI